MSLPSQSYRPAWKLTLFVRLEEYAEDGRLRKLAKGQKIVTNLAGIKDPRSQLDVASYQGPDGNRRYRVVRRQTLKAAISEAVAEGGPQAQTAVGSTFELVGVVPRNMHVERQGIRQADTLHATLRFPDLPLDPRVVRACGVFGYLGSLSDREFSDAVRGAGGARGALASLPDTFDGGRRSNLRFRGWVDKWTTTWPDDGEATVELECRDNTSLLIDQEMPPRLTMSAEKPVDEAVAVLLSNFPQMEGMDVEYRPIGEAPPALKGALFNTAHRPNLGPTASKGAGSKLSVFDYLTDNLAAIGHAVFVDGDQVIVQRVQSLTTQRAVRRPGDPYQPRVVDGSRLDYRRFVYGRNVGELKITRNFSKSAPTNIEVRCYSGARKKTLVARYPEKPEERVIHPGLGESAEQKWLVWRVSGIADEKALRVVARSIYEAIGRNELSTVIATKALASLGGGSADPDVLDMNAGDTVEVYVNRGSSASGDPLTTFESIESALSDGSRAQAFLTAQGFPTEFAAAYGRAYAGAGFQNVFRVKSVAFECDIDSGVEVTMNVVNYVEARLDSGADAAPK